MTEATVVTTQIDPETLANLDKLATHLDRSRAWLVGRAVTKYVQEETLFLDFIQQGDDAIDRGEVFSQEEMEAWFAERTQSRAA